MLRLVEEFNKYLDIALKVTGWSSAIAILLMTLVVGYDVFARFVGHPTIWAFDVSLYLLIWMSFLGAAYGLRKGSHFRVTILTSRISERKARFLEIGFSLLGIGFCIFFFQASLCTMLISTSQNLHAPTLLYAPLWIPQLALPVGSLFLCLAFLQLMVNDIVKELAVKGNG